MFRITCTTGVQRPRIAFPKILRLGFAILKKPQKTVFLTLTDNREIQKLNQKYRKKDSPTDVLSFNYHDARFPFNGAVLGEIIISVEQAKRQALKAHQSSKTEIIKLFIHGFLHLSGYTHQRKAKSKQMAALEEKIFTAVSNESRRKVPKP